jgi:hypothetical protein
LIQRREQITNLKRRLRSWTTVNKNGNFSFVRVKNAWFPQFSLQIPIHKKKKNKGRKPNKLALLKQFNMVWLTSLLSYFGTSRTSSLTFIIMRSSSIKLAM